jgi:hypothetical protein
MFSIRRIIRIARLYASKVAGDEQIAAVLQATRGLDRWAADPQ